LVLSAAAATTTTTITAPAPAKVCITFSISFLAIVPSSEYLTESNYFSASADARLYFSATSRSFWPAA
jgi:hypothetical protein